LQFLTANDWALIRDKTKERTFHKDQLLIQEGLIGNNLYVLRTGTARVERKTENGPVRIATLHPGDICGEMAFVEKGRSSASVIADEDLVADVLESGTLSSLFESFPHVASRFFRSICLVLSQRLRNTSAELAKRVSAPHPAK